MGLYQRCITRGVPNAIFPAVYNANTRIVQGQGFVAVTYEMIHETRVIPTTPRPRLQADVRQYLGDSRGRWEGDTLVVDVSNFNSKDDYRGSGAGLHLVERYKRTPDGGLRYEVTVEDPDTWSRPWTAALDLRPQQGGVCVPRGTLMPGAGRHVRVRMPRGQLRDEEHAQRIARRRRAVGLRQIRPTSLPAPRTR